MVIPIEYALMAGRFVSFPLVTESINGFLSHKDGGSTCK